MPSQRRKQSKAAWSRYEHVLVQGDDSGNEQLEDSTETLDDFEKLELPEQCGDVGDDATDGYKTPPSTTRMSNPSRPQKATRPRGAFGDVLVDCVLISAVSGAHIVNINTNTDDWSTYRIRTIVADILKVATKFVNLADEGGRLVLDCDPITTEVMTAIVGNELST